MVLISEDRRFFRHNGIDWLSILRVVSGIINLRFYGGASTVDMQFVRTATEFYEKSLRRKVYEMLLARIIQYRYSKAQILRSYLSCAFLGSGIYGVSRASLVIFGKMPFELDLTEAAQLASMLVYPRPLVPDNRWKLKLDRRSKYLVSLYPSLKERFEKLPSWDAV
ncbi:biosynthetic peptidoglycan transglycosylase [Pleomorphomonas sp. PLEO]|uniref:biosynthetic peptidoglycan transglycosylase n=1 Tax=Pleomorphomonas sp. PLEO TaxID=3239306 RepID=UPI00351E25B3